MIHKGPPKRGHRIVIGDRRISFFIALLGMLLLAPGALFATPASATDGPYVQMDGKDRWAARWVEPSDGGQQVRSESVAVGQQVTVREVEKLPAFEVRLRAPASPAPDETPLSSSTPLLVVADTHGEYEILARLLRKQGVIDDRLHWTFGTGHLAFLGDVFDRGAHQTEILWLIYELEAEAAAAGGAVHLLLGNHEAMVLRGDARYLNPKYVQTAQAFGAPAYSELFGPQTLLGQWLSSKPAVLKLGDLLLLHGGISPELVDRDLSLGEINATVRGVLDGTLDADRELPTFVMKSSGPLWYRGYFPMDDAPPKATQVDVDAALRHFGVEKILVGHTIVPAVTPLYGGKVIAVQVYPHFDEKTEAAVMEAALRIDGAWYRARVDGSREPLPDNASPSR
ncbi:metallophosphoesterase [Pseudoxanthomonas putridarboris]|uniref:Metallophosphoesterase n=1 Tax=Pseudoxanthomonas putridarboris TaxID=752605 RepID=A0ABU9IV53_9GAMM